MTRSVRPIAFLTMCLALFPPMRAETGYDAWLRYAPVDPASAKLYANLPAVVFTSGGSPILEAAQAELVRGVRGMLGKTLHVESNAPAGDAIVLETFDAPVEGTYLLQTTRRNGHNTVKIAGAGDRGVLYGVFAFLRRIAFGRDIENLDEQAAPQAPVRWTNEWDNLDGSIERGYAGRSIFFENAHVVPNLTRARDYVRLLASIGVNGCTVNSVNTDPRTLTSPFVAELARIADAFRPWGVRMSIAIDFSSPKSVGGLDTFDPLDGKVGAWWKEKADEVYRSIPDLAGFVLKADGLNGVPAERLAQRDDRIREVRFCHIGIRPQGLDQFLLANELFGLSNKNQQSIESFRR